jgi:hypothetical protein
MLPVRDAPTDGPDANAKSASTDYGGASGGRPYSSRVSEKEPSKLHATVEVGRPAPADAPRTPQRHTAKATRSPIRSIDFWLVFLAVAVIAVLFADRLRLPALVVAVIAATALERHRQATRRTPLTLTETPRAWRRTIETTIGLRAALLSAASSPRHGSCLPTRRLDLRVRPCARRPRPQGALAPRACVPSRFEATSPARASASRVRPSASSSTAQRRGQRASEVGPQDEGCAGLP